MKTLTTQEIMKELNRLYPNAHCELNHTNTYELAVAVILSAQTTDASVNQITPELFKAYPDVQSLAKATVQEVEPYISRLGLYHNKAKMIVGFAQGVVDRFAGIIPSDMKDLTSLPGIGRKCANVIRAECFHIPSFAVDTHVARIAKRLGLAYQKDTPDKIEKKLCKKFPEDQWIRLHHQMIFFGRKKCHARSPECDGCPFRFGCHEKHKCFKEPLTLESDR